MVSGNLDGFVQSPIIVMPDLIRHPEPVEFTGFRLPPDKRDRFQTFYELINLNKDRDLWRFLSCYLKGE